MNEKPIVPAFKPMPFLIRQKGEIEPVYPCDCPVCDDKFLLQISEAMLHGVNGAVGTCSSCKALIWLQISEDATRIEGTDFSPFLVKFPEVEY